MSDDSQTTTQKTIGRPRKPLNRTKGAMVWVSAEYMDLMTSYLEFLKQQTVLNNEKWGKVKQ